MRALASAQPEGTETERASGPSRPLLYALLVVMVFFWALNLIVGKYALRDFPALLLSGLRGVVAAALLVPVYVWRARRKGLGWKPACAPLLLLLGVFGVALNQLGFIVGLSRTSVAHAAIIGGCIPLMVLLMAWLVRQEAMTPGKAAGMLIALGEVAVLQTARQPGANPTPLGDLLVLMGGFAFAIFTVGGKRLTGQLDGLTLTTWAYLGGALVLGPLAAWESRGFSYARVSAAGWLSMMYMAIFPAVISYLIFYYALGHIPASRVSAFSYLQPPIATLLAVPFLGEPVTGAILGGMALVFGGVWVTQRS